MTEMVEANNSSRYYVFSADIGATDPKVLKSNQEVSDFIRDEIENYSSMGIRDFVVIKGDMLNLRVETQIKVLVGQM